MFFTSAVSVWQSAGTGLSTSDLTMTRKALRFDVGTRAERSGAIPLSSERPASANNSSQTFLGHQTAHQVEKSGRQYDGRNGGMERVFTLSRGSFP